MAANLPLPLRKYCVTGAQIVEAETRTAKFAHFINAFCRSHFKNLNIALATGEWISEHDLRGRSLFDEGRNLRFMLSMVQFNANKKDGDHGQSSRRRNHF
ncbi:hypothetical protein DXM21_24220 [Agrobacterium rosae]|nr:hypothetical protein DXM21_24220 [Agrobacterium rosae]KAA3512519.1 hypothetical protein DXM25_24410 [Agrobacterium rosae]MQB51218.1 hypothetical protein [Agrobacterium rosae]